MEDLLKCVSRAEPSRAELRYSFALLYEYIGCFALLGNGRVFGCAKRALGWDFSPSGALFWRCLCYFRGARVEKKGGEV